MLNLFGEEITVAVIEPTIQISRSLPQEKIERIILDTKKKRKRYKKLIGEPEYFFKTTGKNIYFSDGYRKGNGKGGFTVFKNEELLHTTPVTSQSYHELTNNEAELLGLCYAIEDSSFGDEIIVDSMVALTWLRKMKPKARPDLEYICKPYLEMIYEKELNVYWKPREYNKAGHYNEYMFGA